MAKTTSIRGLEHYITKHRTLEYNKISEAGLEVTEARLTHC